MGVERAIRWRSPSAPFGRYSPRLRRGQKYALVSGITLRPAAEEEEPADPFAALGVRATVPITAAIGTGAPTVDALASGSERTQAESPSTPPSPSSFRPPGGYPSVDDGGRDGRYAPRLRPRESLSGFLLTARAPAIVYSTGPLPVWSRRRSAGRALRTTGAMAALAAALWWAVAQLGAGLSAVVDLVGGPPAPGG